jgi:pimeloyl-ACP methyl ester carboxylesterase
LIVRGVAVAAPARRLQGEIAGARWTALVPENWNGRLLLEAPDRRNAPAPLVATLDETTPDNATLLDSGWALATTSYRRTGPILIDAIEDLRALREHLATEIGVPQMTIIAGDGMGGLIAALMAERHSDEFHAFLARDPQLTLRDPRALRLRCDGQPRGPLLFLFGSSTARGVIDYRDRARSAANAESFVPVLWFQPDPDAKDAEAKPASLPEALAAMVAWTQTQSAPPDRLENLPALEDLQPAVEESKESPPPVEAPPVPDEPPPTVPVDEAATAR